MPDGLVNVPFRWSGVDGYYYLRRGEGPEELESAWNHILDTADAVTLIAHAHLSCLDDARFAALDRILGRLATDPAITVLTAGEAAGRRAG
jgi:hypothetical protein